MLSSSDGKKRRGHDTPTDGWAPWMDDRTTTNYQAQHLGYLHARKDAPQWNPALQFDSLTAPEELSFSSWGPAAVSGAAEAAARTGVQPALKTLHGLPALVEPAPPARKPRASTERTLSHGWQAAPAPQLATPGFTLASPLEPPKLQPVDLENPFERRSALGYWLTSTAAGLGLFAAVLLGRVVLVAGGQAAAKPPTAEVSSRTAPPMAAIAADAASAGSSQRVSSPDLSRLASGPEPAAMRSQAAADGGARATGHAARSTGTDARPVRGQRSSGADSSVAGRAARASGAAAEGDAPARPRRASLPGEDSSSAAPSGAPGLLRINSRPWSQVTLDGTAVGHTPLLDLRVAPGSHSLRLVNPEFGLSKSIQVKVAAGETVTRVELLEP